MRTILNAILVLAITTGCQTAGAKGPYAEGKQAGTHKQIEHTNYSPFVSDVKNFSQVSYGLIGKASAHSSPPPPLPKTRRESGFTNKG